MVAVVIVIDHPRIGPLLLDGMRQQAGTTEQIDEHPGIGESGERLAELAEEAPLLPHERQRRSIVNRFLHWIKVCIFVALTTYE